ncbi:MAG: ROK family protein, partial [Candidatus Njordarchaeota archaeon]
FSKRNVDNIVYVTLSSGIGGGAIIDGNVLFGKDGNAVEIGHFVVDPMGNIQCGCGGYGHWEAYTSGANIHKFCRLLIEQKFSFEKFRQSLISSLTDVDNVTYEILSICAQKNDTLALEIFNEIGKINAIGFANIINAFDPDVIVVGGSIVLKNPTHLVLSPIQKYVEDLTINRMPKIEKTHLEDDAVLLGALKIAMDPELIPRKFRENI